MRQWIVQSVLLSVLVLTACSPRLAPGSPDGIAAEEPAAPISSDTEAAFTRERLRLVQQGIVGMGISDPATIAALETVPRHRFVPDGYLDQAYRNQPLPIGYGQTISQPYIVALMTEALALEPDDRVLEIGTGSGYQAAVLAEIVEKVYTIEIIGALAEQSAERLAALGYDNVEVRHADGYFGWEEQAPFDAIMVTAAPDHIPAPLQTQLADGGRMVIPVGPVGGYQELWLIERHGDEFTSTSLGGVRFVPFTREVQD